MMRYTCWPEYASNIRPLGRVHIQDTRRKWLTLCGKEIATNWRCGQHFDGEEPLSGWCASCLRAESYQLKERR
jgi:hypothetical protein